MQRCVLLFGGKGDRLSLIHISWLLLRIYIRTKAAITRITETMAILPAIMPFEKDTTKDESFAEAPNSSSIPSNMGKILVTNNMITKDIITKSIAG